MIISNTINKVESKDVAKAITGMKDVRDEYCKEALSIIGRSQDILVGSCRKISEKRVVEVLSKTPSREGPVLTQKEQKDIATHKKLMELHSKISELTSKIEVFENVLAQQSIDEGFAIV